MIFSLRSMIIDEQSLAQEENVLPLAAEFVRHI